MKELGYDFDEIHHNLAKKSKPLRERRVGSPRHPF
jgi:hypothetical protein